MRIDLCRNGHLMDEANTRWRKTEPHKAWRQCRVCARNKARLKYRNDDNYRIRKITTAREAYRARKAASETDRGEKQEFDRSPPA